MKNWLFESSCLSAMEPRDRLQAAQTTTEELSRLRSENAQLQRELQETQSRPEGIQKFLAGANRLTNTATQTAPVAPTTANTTSTMTSAPDVTQSAAPKLEVQRNRGKTTEKINQIIDALISWNNSQEDSEKQLRISIPTIISFSDWS